MCDSEDESRMISHYHRLLLTSDQAIMLLNVNADKQRIDAIGNAAKCQYKSRASNLFAFTNKDLPNQWHRLQSMLQCAAAAQLFTLRNIITSMSDDMLHWIQKISPSRGNSRHLGKFTEFKICNENLGIHDFHNRKMLLSLRWGRG